MDLSDPAQIRQKALSRWDNEGGASPQGPQEGSTASEGRAEHAPDVTNSEIVLLRVRVIAMENLIIALLADASERQLELAREITDYILPRPGFTNHPLTIRAASHMSDIVERSGAFRSRRTDAAVLDAFNDRQVETGPVANERDHERPAPGRHPDDR